MRRPSTLFSGMCLKPKFIRASWLSGDEQPILGCRRCHFQPSSGPDSPRALGQVPSFVTSYSSPVKWGAHPIPAWVPSWRDRRTEGFKGAFVRDHSGQETFGNTELVDIYFSRELLILTLIFSSITQGNHAQRHPAEGTEQSCGPADAPLSTRCTLVLGCTCQDEGVLFLNLTKVTASNGSASELLRRPSSQTQAGVYLSICT